MPASAPLDRVLLAASLGPYHDGDALTESVSFAYDLARKPAWGRGASRDGRADRSGIEKHGSQSRY